MLQLPFKVWQLCSKLMETGMPYKATIAVEAAFEMVRSTISRDLNPEDLGTNKNHAAIRANLRGLPQQLEQSGLLEQLPLLLTLISQKLQNSAVVAAAAAGQADHAVERLHAAAAAASCAAFGRTDSSAAPEWEPAEDPDELASNALNIFTDVILLLPDYPTSTVAGRACLLAAMHLVVASRQYLSTCSSILQRQAPGQRLKLLSVMATDTAAGCAAAVKDLYDSSDDSSSADSSSAYAQMAQQLPQDVRYVECTAFSIALWMLMPLVRKYQKRHNQSQQQLDLFVTGPGGPRASVGRSVVGQSQWAPHALVDKVPQPVTDLLQALGCSREAALWAAWGFWRDLPADTITDRAAQQQIQYYAEPYVVMLSEQGHFVGSGQQQQSRQQQERLRQLRLLLSVAYLNWAAAQGTGGPRAYSYYSFRAAWLSLPSYSSSTQLPGLLVTAPGAPSGRVQ